MKILALFGATFLLFWFLGAIGVGNFVVVYSPHKITYTIHKEPHQAIEPTSANPAVEPTSAQGEKP